MSSKKAVVLLSGGLDSSTCVAIAKDQGFEVYALSFRYGQRDNHELDAAEEIAKAMDIKRHEIIDIDLRAFGGSALTDDIDVPKGRSEHEMEEEIPVTYVPARNTIFLSFALAFAETLSCNDIFIGVNALDYSGYPDCRPEYIAAFQDMARLATKIGVEGDTGVRINTPLIDMTKAEIIKTGLELGVDYSLTNSCYDPDENGIACAECDSCLLRLKGFSEAGHSDPIAYQP
ncbi:MAG: 7-cyano-7-deazaguanine synthase QueC [Kordiimonadaceae bacterium]|jgi:7-cyano-7-deazaguanine synthase|nr:7-cyano-7-deazaguanine synthase QueC [Kordiimonadaceae bacterium]MBT6035919.1 7-cyano-7-deazaguanine synthase QueC [Kordiimonadaceae bacterium]MBT6330712.1 7-cyano-7-deazaguanine synthase QueC [Kordiimonadaceae bacterium]MBT7581798.1 7-cyano-7-deazaguanine synthase QueC [Kordiimonadaceae bacterium]